MSDTIQSAIVISIAPTISAIVAAFIAFRANRKLTEIHITMNSKLDALVKATGAAEFARGHQEGVEQERNR